ncbi:DUF262 domain-containing protein [Crocosphaera sp. XPORK-15E]|uniref:DUF262 domain-containing protein n=1 Tax=Crocosphaera sp. XPORK-15E TaxID=3110247 RepID=UPI002B20FEE3|nr:DUF262 domain-containing protein [Crocosphaera sp. XPORK-15E]MEA5536797.1 DUF262 domain-containing protein [Crocosphaera sp. XPORK-15E]
MTLSLSDQELNNLYEADNRGFINERDRVYLPRLVEDIKLRQKYQFTRPQSRQWNTEIKSHLIESIIFNIPVAPIILYTSDDNVYEVIDGNQRLRAIIDFYDNKFELTGVEVYPELNGYNYQSLPYKIRDRLDKRRLVVCIVIKPSNNQLTDEQCKQLIRERFSSEIEEISQEKNPNDLWFEEDGLWFHPVEDGYHGALEKNGEKLITVYGGKVQISSYLPSDINKARKIAKLYEKTITKHLLMNL